MFPGLVGGDEGIIVNDGNYFIIPGPVNDQEIIPVSGDDRGQLSHTELVGTLELRGRESSKLQPVVSVAVILPLVQPECLGWVQSSLSKGLTPRLTILVSLKDLGCRTELLGRYSISLYSEYLSLYQLFFISRYDNPEVYEVFIDLHIY